MAANIPRSCLICGKSGGIVLCNGCNQTLCFKHVNEHSNDIEKQLDHLINQQNHFENELEKSADSHYLFNQIDQWKKDSIEQIKQIAKQTKQHLKNLIDQSNEDLLNKSKEIKENIRLLKESEDLSEIELIKLSNQFNHLKNQINSFQLIKSSDSIFLKIEKQENDQIIQIKELTQSSSSLKLSPNIEETHSKREGSIIIHSIDPYGHRIIIEHSGLTTNKDQDMVGWTLKRSIDSTKDIIYRFPNDFILKSKSSVQIVSREASERLFSYENVNTLIAQSIETWGFGVKNIINRLIDANGDDKHILIQTFHSFK